MQIGLQIQRGVAHFQIPSVSQQEVAVLEHPQVARPVVNRPQGLGLNRSFRQIEEYGANLALVLVASLAVHQTRHAKGKQQPVLIEKIQ